VWQVLVQSLISERRGLAAWGGALIGFTAMYAALWPSVHDQPAVAAVMRSLPSVVRTMLGASDMSTATGYVQAELLGLTGPLLVIAHAVAAASAGLAGEERRGRLDLLLALPVTRAQVLAGKAAAMAIGTVALAAVAGAALLLAGRLGGPVLPAGGVAATCVHLALLGMVFGSLAVLVAAAGGGPAAARGVPALVALLAYVLNGVAPLAGWPPVVQDLSPFAQYQSGPPLLHGISVDGVLVAVVTVAALLALAVATFRRRDLRS
jgi:ABC-2 type transport system permease protein